MAERTGPALHLPPGPPGSGRLRYAAAMEHHAHGELSDAALEAFRELAPRDRDDPATLLGGERLPSPSPQDPAEALETLRREFLDLLHHIRGPGIAETRHALATARDPARTRAGDCASAEAWLPSALSAVATTAPALAGALSEAAPHLSWQRYTYPGPEIGPHFPERHSFCPLVGEGDAPFPASGLEVGLFLMAPGLFYRDHAHTAPELYLPLTGPHGWRFAPGAPLVEKPAFDPVWNDPGLPHAIKAGGVPFLALYAWLGHTQAPAWIVPAPDWASHEGSA